MNQENGKCRGQKPPPVVINQENANCRSQQPLPYAHYDAEPDDKDSDDDEKYAEYVRKMMREKGYDYDQWTKQAMDDEGESNDEDYETLSEDIDYTSPEKPYPGRLMGMKSFRYFETRVLANFIKDSEDERMQKIQARLGCMKQVPAPVVRSSVRYLHSRPGYEETPSREEMAPEMEKHLKEYSIGEWALKHAASFLQKSGCVPPVEKSLVDLRIPEKDMDPYLKEFLKKGGVGEKRRMGIGSAAAAPEVDASMKRRAERAVWRYIINTAKPKYPLPRFILPRYKYLKRVEAELIGPGSYEHYEGPKCHAKMPSLFKSCSSRFPKENDKLPYPGAAFIIDAHSAWDAACEHKRHPGKVPMFQSTPCNFRYKNFYVGCGLSPAHYNIKSPMEEFLNYQKTLRRGMYATGSGTDKFCPKTCTEYNTATESSDSLFSRRRGPGAYDLRLPLTESQSDRYNHFKGVFAKTPRNKMFGFREAYNHPLWPEENGLPGPGTYDPYEQEEWTETDWTPFKVGAKGRKLDDKEVNKLMAPDFYFYRDSTIPEKKDILGDGFKSNFISKTPMTTPQSLHVAKRERNKASNPKFDQDNFYKKKRTTKCD